MMSGNFGQMNHEVKVETESSKAVKNAPLASGEDSSKLDICGLAL